MSWATHYHRLFDVRHSTILVWIIFNKHASQAERGDETTAVDSNEISSQFVATSPAAFENILKQLFENLYLTHLFPLDSQIKCNT